MYPHLLNFPPKQIIFTMFNVKGIFRALHSEPIAGAEIPASSQRRDGRAILPGQLRHVPGNPGWGDQRCWLDTVPEWAKPPKDSQKNSEPN